MEDIYYLNMSELKSVVKKYNIPINIMYRDKNKNLLNTGYVDRKIIIINKILEFYNNNKVVEQTVYKNSIVNFDVKTEYKKSDKVYYGQFNSTNKGIIKLMKSLTNNKYKNGSIAFTIIKDMGSK